VFPTLFLIACHLETMVANVLRHYNDTMHWELTFNRYIQDWESDSLMAPLELLYANLRLGNGEDTICWRVDKSKCFTGGSYYRVLTGTSHVSFPWKIIWKSRVPPRVAFFVWTTALGKILTIDNLRGRHVMMMDWCCICKNGGESVDHLFLH
jgi:hypothetical protein